MPVVYNRQLDTFTKIGVWHITEDENFFLEQVPLQRDINHPHKRLQHLAGRYLLKTLFPQFPISLILIADTRKPFLHNEAFHFSISHCGNYAAAIVSSKNRVGVDIEIPHEKIEKIQHKFLSDKEKKILHEYGGDKIKNLTMAWSIKEALFKWYGTGQVDFIKDMNITSLHRTETGYDVNCVFKKEKNVSLVVNTFFLEGTSLAWLVTDN